MKRLSNKILSILTILLINIFFIGSVVIASEANFSLQIIEPSQCMDGIDNDGDGKTDYPADLQCLSPRDDSEGTHGPGNPSITIITISGKTFPNAKIQILKDGESIVHLKSNNDGNFFQSIFGFYSGTYHFGILAEDKNKNTTSIYSFNITSRPGAVISAVGVYLQPTIAIDRDHIAAGEDINIDGYGIPNSVVSIKIKNKTTGSETYINNKKTDRKGYYFYELDSYKMSVGEYEISSTTKGGDYETNESKKVYLNIEKEGTIINNSENYNHNIKCDLDKDTSVNLVDFSILLFHWMSSSYKDGDFNNDGIIDIKDFSIMAYNWTGN